MGDDYSEQTCFVLPVYPDQPAMVSPAFAKSTMKRAPGGNTDDKEFVAEQHVIRRVRSRPCRYLFVPNEKVLPKGFNLDGLTMRREMVILLAGVEDNIFEDECRPQRIRDIIRDQENPRVATPTSCSQIPCRSTGSPPGGVGSVRSSSRSCKSSACFIDHGERTFRGDRLLDSKR